MSKRKEVEAIGLRSLLIVDSDKKVVVSLHGIEVSISHEEFSQMINWYVNRLWNRRNKK